MLGLMLLELDAYRLKSVAQARSLDCQLHTRQDPKLFKGRITMHTFFPAPFFLSPGFSLKETFFFFYPGNFHFEEGVKRILIMTGMVSYWLCKQKWLHIHVHAFSTCELDK